MINYECDIAEKKLLENLYEAEETANDEKAWLALEELKVIVGE